MAVFQRRVEGHRRPSSIIILLTAGLLASVLLFLFLGRGPGGWTFLAWQDVNAFLPGRLTRLTRLSAAVSAGALLAASGAILQRLTSNPLASPEVMGVSAAAALGYGVAVFLLPAAGALALSLSAMAGGALVLMVIAHLAIRRNLPPERVLLAGLAMGAVASAFLSAMMSVGDARAFAILGWLAGSVAFVSALGAGGLLVLAFGVAALCVLAQRWLALLPMGDDISDALGVPRIARLILILVAGIATGAATVVVGPVSFVGLMAPHIARTLGLVRPIEFTIGAIVIGASLMMVADAGARLAAFPYELPMGLFATLLGTPWLMLQLMRKSQ